MMRQQEQIKILGSGRLDAKRGASDVCDGNKAQSPLLRPEVDHLVREWADVTRAILMRRQAKA